jgi:hypothetical protein
VPLSVPDHALVGAGEQLDRLGQLAVAGDRAVRGPIQTHQLGQHVCIHVCIPSVAFGPRGRVPLAVAGDLDRVDRIHLVARGEQCLDPRAPVGLDADHDLVRLGVLGRVGGGQLVQSPDPVHAFAQPCPGQPPAQVVNQLDIMVAFGPIVPNKQHPVLPSRQRWATMGSAREDSQRANGQVLTARHPISGQPPDHWQGHGLTVGLNLVQPM